MQQRGARHYSDVLCQREATVDPKGTKENGSCFAAFLMYIVQKLQISIRILAQINQDHDEWTQRLDCGAGRE